MRRRKGEGGRREVVNFPRSFSTTIGFGLASSHQTDSGRDLRLWWWGRRFGSGRGEGGEGGGGMEDPIRRG